LYDYDHEHENELNSKKRKFVCFWIYLSNVQHFCVYNEQMNEEELPINKNYKELKGK